MKLNISNYEVTISAKNTCSNKSDTAQFLCNLCGALMSASESMDEHGYKNLATVYSEYADSIYDALDKRGFFDNLRYV